MSRKTRSKIRFSMKTKSWLLVLKKKPLDPIAAKRERREWRHLVGQDRAKMVAWLNRRMEAELQMLLANPEPIYRTANPLDLIKPEMVQEITEAALALGIVAVRSAP